MYAILTVTPTSERDSRRLTERQLSITEQCENAIGNCWGVIVAIIFLFFYFLFFAKTYILSVGFVIIAWPINISCAGCKNNQPTCAVQITVISNNPKLFYSSPTMYSLICWPHTRTRCNVTSRHRQRKKASYSISLCPTAHRIRTLDDINFFLHANCIHSFCLCL